MDRWSNTGDSEDKDKDPGSRNDVIEEYNCGRSPDSSAPRTRQQLVNGLFRTVACASEKSSYKFKYFVVDKKLCESERGENDKDEIKDG